MGIRFSNPYVVYFTAGTLLGATCAYITTQCNVQSIFHPKVSSSSKSKHEDDEYRLVLAIRSDLKMQKGKVAAQCGHASVAAYAKALAKTPRALKRWLGDGNGTKIALRIDSEKEMMDLAKNAKGAKVMVNIVRDAGHTQVAPGSKTVLALGPARKSALEALTGHLKLY